MAVNRGRTPNVKLNYINYDAVGWNTAEDENWSLLDSMISQFIKINGIVGTWKNSTQYNTGDVVVDVATGVLWVCQTGAVSPATGSFSDARAAATSQWQQKNAGDDTAATAIVRPEDFGASTYEDDPTVDSTAAVQQAIASAILKGAPLQLSGLYRLTAPSAFNLANSDRLAIRGLGGFFCDGDTAGNPFIDINVQPASTVVIVSMDNTVTRDFAGQGNLTDSAKLVFAAGHGLLKGQVGRVISDDAISDGTGVEFVGEVVYIGDVDANGTDVYLANRLRNTYTTNPRIVIYNEGPRLQVSDIAIAGNGPQNIVQARKWVGIRVTGMVNPIFERLRCTDGSNAFIQANGCIHTLFAANQFERGYDNISGVGITGYGIRDINPEFSQVIANRGHDVRSLYKADTTVSTPANPFSYGAPHGGLVSENQANVCSGPAIDTGQVALSYVFDGNRTYNPYQGNNTAYCGIQAWGRRHTILSHRHGGAGAGILLGTNAPGEDARHIIRDLYYNGSFVGIYCRPTPTGCVFDMQDSEIITTYTFGAVSLNGCTMYGRDNRYVLRGTTTNRRVYALLGSANVFERNPTYDFSQVAATKSWVVGYQVVSNQIDIQGGEVIAGANAWTGIVFSDIITPVAVAARFVLTADLAPADTDGIDAAIVSAAVGTFYPYIRVAGANAYTSNFKQVTPTVVSNHWTGTIDGCVAESVIRSYVMTVASNSINNIEAGLFKGQELVLINDPTSTQNWSVLAVALNVSLPADAALSPGAGLRFIWNGTLWVAISVGVSVTGGITVTAHHSLTGFDAFDDHTQYLNNARFDTRLAAQNIGVLADVPDSRGTAYQVLRVNSGATGMEYANAVAVPQARDAVYVAPSTHVADTAGLVDASVSLYPIATVTKVALRLFASTAKAIWLQLADHAFNILVDWKEASDGTPELRIRNAAASAVKHFIGGVGYAIFGGDSGARVGTETVGVVGDLYVSGNIIGPVQGGDYTAPYLIGAIRVWDDGAGKLRAKSGSDPANATDGSVLW